MKCPKCGRKLKVRRTVHKNGIVTVRYLACPRCRFKEVSVERLRKK